MNIEIRFSLVEGPDRALGDVKGKMHVPTIPKAGDRIEIAPGSERLKRLGLPAKLLVSDVTRHEVEGDIEWVAYLEDLIVENESAGKALAHALEADLGMFVWAYRDSMIDDDDDG